MTHPHARSGASIAVVVALTAGLAAPAYAAPTKQECFTSSQSGQELQRNGKLRDARAQFITCASPSCPSLVRADCAQHVDDVNRAMPTLVLEARDADGSDLSAVTVTVDGAPLLERIDGRPVEIDPGEHKLRFAAAGRVTLEKSFVIREGEKGRHERVVFASPAAAPAPAPPVLAPPPHAAAPALAPPPMQAPPSSPPAPDQVASPGATQRMASYVLGGVGVVGIGVGSAFGLMASSSYNQARTDCGGGCSATSKAQSEKSNADSQATVSTVAFLAGGVALAAGVVIFFTAPKGHGEKAASVSLVPGVGPSSASLLLGGRF